MRGSARRAGRPLRRQGRLLVGRNELRRPADRIEAAVIITLAAAFLTAAIAAACVAGRLCQSEHTRRRACGRRWRYCPSPARLPPSRRLRREPCGGCPMEPNGLAPSPLRSPPLFTARLPERRYGYGWTAPENQRLPRAAWLT